MVNKITLNVINLETWVLWEPVHDGGGGDEVQIENELVWALEGQDEAPREDGQERKFSCHMDRLGLNNYNYAYLLK